jgi:predicted component of type VI protein secretion system
VFIILIVAILSLLVFIGSAMVTKIKWLQSNAKEKVVIAELITRELDEFKKKAMDKQIKLARELQDERNKLADLKQRLAH